MIIVYIFFIEVGWKSEYWATKQLYEHQPLVSWCLFLTMTTSYWILRPICIAVFIVACLFDHVSCQLFICLKSKSFMAYQIMISANLHYAYFRDRFLISQICFCSSFMNDGSKHSHVRSLLVMCRNMMVMLRGVETSLGTTKHARFYEGFGQGWPVSNTRQKIYQTHKVVWLSIIAPLSTWT